MDLISLSKELLKQDIIPRKRYYQELDDTIKANQVTVIQWQRRVGKSYTILWYLKTQWINPDKIFFLNKELDSENEIQDVKDLNTLFDSYTKKYGEPEYIFIDEIQDIKDRERFIRAKFTLKKYKIIISGSNSQLLSGELATYLTGRYLAFEVYPLDFSEYLIFSWEKDSHKALQSYLRWGGLPELVSIENDAKKTSYISTIIQTIVYKDIVKRYTIKDVEYLEKIMHYIADVVGSQVSLRNIIKASKEYGRWEPSTATVSNYLNFLQQPYLIHKVRRFDVKWKKIIEHNEKYYFNDIGIRNFFKVDMKMDIGKLVENVVYLHLKKCGYTVYVWNIWDKEIDFVAQKGQDMCYIQVAYIMSDQSTIDREFWNLAIIKDNYPKYVVSMDTVAEGNIQWVQWMQLARFIEEFR